MIIYDPIRISKFEFELSLLNRAIAEAVHHVLISGHVISETACRVLLASTHHHDVI